MEKSTRLLAHKVGPPVAVPNILCACRFCCQFHLSLSFIFFFLSYIAFDKGGYTGIQINDVGFLRISLDMIAETYYNLYNSLKAITMFLGELFIN